ncbi:CHC2 zinc finger domain-containing protein [Clostridium butyricum]|uniref:CHC2 zinc finger domain-containing protein n=1 Tax=Clostridium butyricum TaxID=1492 RepID=UPI0022DEB93C|nr:CHC2 zinc finger domain-containing protein [Clostridium butyricum]MDU3584403.1 CHC2 zinc finger domain-containing protein [Clostridium butyricum]
MDNNYLDSLIGKVRANVNISSVVGKYITLKSKGNGEYEGLCPFHNDKSLGSFKVSDEKKVCKCFSCGVGKDVISFYAHENNLNYIESLKELAYSANVISQSEYDEISKIKVSDRNAKKIELTYIKKDQEKFKYKIASDEVLNNVYTAFYNECSLSEEHYKYLKEERYLSYEDIKNGGYFTFPSRKIMRNFEKRLKREYGYEPMILQDVPGFFRNKENGLFSFSLNTGMGICIKNAKGLIVGIQIRREGKNIKNKYIWFSSAAIQKNKKLSEKYEFGTPSHSRIDVIYPHKIEYKTIFITEGRFKAQCIADTFNSIAISVQGIGNWKNIKDEIANIRSKIQIIDFSNIIISYDADMAYNIQVFEQSIKMAKNLKQNIPEMSINYAIWDFNYGKGIDDLIYAGHKDMLESININEFTLLYDNFINSIEKKYGDIVKNKVSKYILKEYYQRLVLTKENFPKVFRYIERNSKNVVGL